MSEANIPAVGSSRSGAIAVKKMNSVHQPKVIATVLVIILLLLAGSGGWLFYQTKLSRLEKEWQAVFLTNGQVYFGHVKKQNNNEIVVEDIYYLQVVRPLQQGDSAPAEGQGELTLVKLGNELHKPTDKMYINRQHVLFMEDLKDDSNVVQAIINYKNGQ